MCKAILDLMADSREKGMQEGIAKGMQEGIEKGMQEGIEKGMQEGKEIIIIEIAKKLLDVLSDEVIAEKLGLSLDKVEKLRVADN